MPCVSTTVGMVACWSTEVEVCAVWIVGIDSKPPEAVEPVERAIEIVYGAEACVLPGEEYVGDVDVTPSPIFCIDIVWGVYSHEIVEVHLIGSFVLLFCKVELVSHFVC